MEDIIKEIICERQFSRERDQHATGTNAHQS